MRRFGSTRVLPTLVRTLLVLPSALAACTESTDPDGSVGSIALVSGRDTFVAGDTVRMVAAVLDPNGAQLDNRTIRWTSRAPAIATVSSGLVTGVGGGLATIVASAEGVADSAVVTVVSPLLGVQVSAGTWSTCAVTVAAQAYCWGDGVGGLLGNGLTGGQFLRPSLVVGGLAWASVTIGQYHACGLAVAGMPYCWGGNYLGVLGASIPDVSSIPLALPVSSSVSVVVAGDLHTCVLHAQVAECWGYLLGAPTPQFASLTSDGYHLCGLTSAAEAYCWGLNDFGELGDGTTSDRPAPTAVSGGKGFVSIDPGWRSTCAVDDAGAGWCWGANVDGQLGDGTTGERHFPVTISGGVKFQTLSAGYGHSCGVSLYGTAYCWGRNDYGQIGDGTFEPKLVPVPVAGDLKFLSVSAGIYHSCGVTVAGLVYCWGNNEVGQLGDNSRNNRNVPVRVWGPSTPAAVSVSVPH